MLFSDKTRFWIIFDTCTRPEYYKDVHNLLALPRGTTMRYEYRDMWLSPSALEAATSPATAPQKILLVYAQWQGYRKGEGTPRNIPPSSEMIWLPTRIADMQLIVQEGANFFFDFKILDYPTIDNDQLMRILNPLIQAQEVPFYKWVSLSNDIQSFPAMLRGDEDENWQSIVDNLGSFPRQFRGDSFWRLVGPFRSTERQLFRPTYKKQIRKTVSSYELFENESCVIEVVSHNPPQTSQQARRLEIQFDKDGPLSVIGDTSFDLRQYTAFNIEVKAKRFEEMDEKTGTIWLSSSPQPSTWPIGPKLSIRFTIKKKKWRAIASLLTLVLGSAAILFAGKQWEEDPICALIIGVIGFLLIVIKELLVSGKLPLKL